MNNTEALSMILKGMDFDEEDLIRVVSALGEIKKKQDEKKEEDLCKFYETNRSGLFKKLLRRACEQYKLSIDPVQVM
tara:strand:- start:933 stop:1163 length:231 start_codon:yes stop_codon:yes gene_type:complete